MSTTKSFENIPKKCVCECLGLVGLQFDWVFLIDLEGKIQTINYELFKDTFVWRVRDETLSKVYYLCGGHHP